MDSSIIIVGGGAFGTSTAWHLAEKGYSNITVLDRFPPPSKEAASSDISKIIRTDYQDPLHCELAVEAQKSWKSNPLYKGLYHQPGWILCAKEKGISFVERSVETSKKLGITGIERLTPHEVRSRFNGVITGKLPGWKSIIYNPAAGWAEAAHALEALANDAMKKGVRYVSGNKGWMSEPIVENDRCIGIATKDGSRHFADLVILATGAWTGGLLETHQQLSAKGIISANIQLTPEEAKKYQNMPIVDNLEAGGYFPPTRNNIFKLGYKQFVKNDTVSPNGIMTSYPRVRSDFPKDGLAPSIEAEMREGLADVFPELADRPFVFTRVAWCTETEDLRFLIDYHPTISNMMVATGGSAHAFKFMPTLGKYIVQCMEGSLEPRIAEQWKWRPGIVVDKSDHPHNDSIKDMKDYDGWNSSRGTNGISVHL